MTNKRVWRRTLELLVLAALLSLMLSFSPAPAAPAPVCRPHGPTIEAVRRDARCATPGDIRLAPAKPPRRWLFRGRKLFGQRML